MTYPEFLLTLPKNHYLLNIKQDSRNPIETAFNEQINNAFIIQKNDKTFNDWFRKKLEQIRNGNTLHNISSTLGEIRAFSLLYYSQFKNYLCCLSTDGPDFRSETSKLTRINIEVNTPLGRMENEERTTVKINSTMIEVAPFGQPQKMDDNTTSEVISKISAIKEDEHQFYEDDINILFIDLANPFLFDVFPLMLNHEKPYIYTEERISWGSLWHAFYSKINDPIYDEIDNYHKNVCYTMPYNGRFQKQTKINFAIINLGPRMVVYQSFRKIHDSSIYPMFLSLSNIEYNNLWINWPNKGLKSQVENERIKGKFFKMKYGKYKY